MQEVHILNGDALKDQFPELEGELIVLRECLVDGPVDGYSLESFFNLRADFISNDFSIPKDEYYAKSVIEFKKILSLNNSSVNLWFEDDLFCQVNFWFSCWLLDNEHDNQIYLVRPENHTQYGFGGFNKEELIELYKNRIFLNSEDIKSLSELWSHYQKGNLKAMVDFSERHSRIYPFTTEAIKAHIDRFPKDGQPGLPTKILSDIIEELNTQEFGAIFKEFNKRASIYGFGDAQVEKLYKQLLRYQ